MTKASDDMHNVLKDTDEDTMSSGTAFAGSAAGVADRLRVLVTVIITIIGAGSLLGESIVGSYRIQRALKKR